MAFSAPEAQRAVITPPQAPHPLPTRLRMSEACHKSLAKTPRGRLSRAGGL